MAYCINPKCNARHNPEPEPQQHSDVVPAPSEPTESGRSNNADTTHPEHAFGPNPPSHCRSCGTPLLIHSRYRLSHPLRPLDDWSSTEIFAVDDTRVTSDDPAPQAANQTDNQAADQTADPTASQATATVVQSQPRQKVLKVLKQSRLLPLFEREARTLQNLQHPGIPQVEAGSFFAIPVKGLEEPLAALVMEKVEGETLEQWLTNQGKVKQKQALDWLRQTIEILHQIHQQNLFHRDIKPSNLMRRENGQLVLIDFGTVKSVTQTYLAKIAGGGEVTSIVSPGYTPLEQINGKAVPQSDFYALGRSLVHLVTGKSPLDFPEDPQTGRLLWRDAAPHISEGLALLIDDLIAPFPGQRPPSTTAILQRLDRGLGPIPRARLRPQVIGLIIANALLLLTHMFVFGHWSAAWRAHADDPVQNSPSEPQPQPQSEPEPGQAPDAPADR